MRPAGNLVRAGMLAVLAGLLSLGVWTPSVQAACAPRPAIGVVVTPTPDGPLAITLTAHSTADTPSNQLRAVQFGPVTNGLVDVGTMPASTGDFALALPPATLTYVFTLRQLDATLATTVPLRIADACGDWATFVGAGPNSGQGFGSPVDPIASPICTPRPVVGVATTPIAPEQLQVTVFADSASGAWLQALHFGAADNALLDVGSQTGLKGSFAVNLPPNTRQYTFGVRRGPVAGPVTVPLVVTDGCGDWPTFVGAGFSTPLPPPPPELLPPAATPELDSSVLFGGGGLGLLAYALFRRRSRRR